MKNTSIKKNIIIFIILLIIIGLVIIKLKDNKEQTQEMVYQYNKEQAINVQAESLKYEKIANEYSFTGTFEPNKETKISAAVQGMINKVYVDIGSIVKKEQTLIQLDNALLNLQLESVEVQIEGLEADVSRYTILTKADAVQGVQLEKAVLGLKSAKIQKNTLLEQINKATIKAPFPGIVIAKLSEEGSYAVPGAPLLQIADLSMLKFTINVSETELKIFSNNQVYPVASDAYPEIILQGKTILIGSKGNISNSFPVQFLIKNTADFKIKSGMFGKVLLKVGQEQKQIVIPAAAVVGTALKPQVYLVKNGKAILHNISILKRINNKIIVNNELVEGDIIVTGGFINLYDNANVL